MHFNSVCTFKNLRMHIHMYMCVSTCSTSVIVIPIAGVWSCPTTTGERPPPCDAFTFTAIDDRRAVLFGGNNLDQGRINDVYIIDFHTMVHVHVQ